MKICLIGSTKFKEDFTTYSDLFTKEGFEVLKPFIYSHYDNVELMKGDEEELKEIHNKKIIQSEIIFVIDKDEYLGEGTIEEIIFASKHQRKFAYMSIFERYHYTSLKDYMKI